MNYRGLLAAVLLFHSVYPAHSSPLRISDAYPDKARYAPAEPVRLLVELDGVPTGTERISATLWQLDRSLGTCGPIHLQPSSSGPQILTCTVSGQPYQGYLVDVKLTGADGKVLDERRTAIDVSPDWKIFPRYGYLAHFSAGEGADPEAWIADLNRFHIDGLEFYDFQYRHDQPLAGSVAHPLDSWNDIAGRTVEGPIVTAFIAQAHRYNMMAMAYNASYGAYEDVFTRQNHPLPLQWGTWTTADGPRTAATAKNLPLQASGWSTHFLYYMNQNDAGWQHYLFAQMRDLFKVYPFDGWHVDTYGDQGGYALDGSKVDYFAGFRSFIDNAHAAVGKPIVFNTVNTYGQYQVAHSDADFVYSELWDDHETYASILETAEQVHLARTGGGVVFAAYVNRNDGKNRHAPVKQFNAPSVLLCDAAIFASGGAHIELGDGDRMLSNEYFPSDTQLVVSPALKTALRHYYDYLTAYENYLRGDVQPAAVDVEIHGQPSDALAAPNTIWTIARRRNGTIMLHLINLLGSSDAHWRDIGMNRPEPPLLDNLRIRVRLPESVRAAGWASPDVDDGEFHPLPLNPQANSGSQWFEFTVPQLRYWDTIFLSY